MRVGFCDWIKGEVNGYGVETWRKLNYSVGQPPWRHLIEDSKSIAAPEPHRASEDPQVMKKPKQVTVTTVVKTLQLNDVVIVSLALVSPTLAAMKETALIVLRLSREPVDQFGVSP
ncbi:hypothetical protein EVAR_42805_1 [Eumeta japonica]|uniref:Uncharacterized protein n=1 Tax=Eumeta variegata TaxID=151549 RepID=A0A4C1WJ18_EUMVA|nr:hypothetical protein EVAR_42805_1 [Eumeta japonica]